MLRTPVLLWRVLPRTAPGRTCVLTDFTFMMKEGSVLLLSKANQEDINSETSMRYFAAQ